LNSRDFPAATRPELALAVCHLSFKTLIKKAVESCPESCRFSYLIADQLTAAPEPLRDPDLALKVAREGIARAPDDLMYRQSLGWALYRTGDWKGSLETLKPLAHHGTNNFVLAMAYWQLGDKTAAKATFERGSEWLKGYEQRCAERAKNERTRTYPPPSLLKRFQAEAAALLGVTPPAKPAVSEALPKSPPPAVPPKADTKGPDSTSPDAKGKEKPPEKQKLQKQ
jgi:hypothetical protein